MWVLTLKCFPPLTTSFMINSINMVRCIHSAYLVRPSFRTGASAPQLEQILVWCGEAWGRGHHTAHNSKCGRCLLITFCGRLWLWKKVWETWAGDYTEENWPGARTECGKRKGADGSGLAVGSSRPSCAALCRLGLLWLVQFRSLLLFLLLVFRDLPLLSFALPPSMPHDDPNEQGDCPQASQDPQGQG